MSKSGEPASFPSAQMQALTAKIEDSLRRFERRNTDPHDATVMDTQCFNAAWDAVECMDDLIDEIKEHQNIVATEIRRHYEVLTPGTQRR